MFIISNFKMTKNEIKKSENLLKKSIRLSCQFLSLKTEPNITKF
jgi:hypothetical protein